MPGEQLFFGDKHPEEQPHARPTVFEVPVRVGLACYVFVHDGSYNYIDINAIVT